MSETQGPGFHASSEATSGLAASLPAAVAHALAREGQIHAAATVPGAPAVAAAAAALAANLPARGWGSPAATAHLLRDVAPGLSAGQAGPRYFGFVTGGVTPAAAAADLLAASYDANVQAPRAGESVAVAVEARAAEMVLQLAGVEPGCFRGRSLTTGATASNVLGIACGREWVVARMAARGTTGADGNSAPLGPHRIDPDRDLDALPFSLADEGILSAVTGPAKLSGLQVLHADGHGSVGKAASLVGIGRSHCADLSQWATGQISWETGADTDEGAGDFNLAALEHHLRQAYNSHIGCIVVASFGEVNTGGFTSNMAAVRKLCDEYDAWLHIDAAFGMFSPGCADLELADSITTDGHKWLNVPYDCGIFYTRTPRILQRVFTPTTATGLALPDYLRQTTVAPGGNDPRSAPLPQLPQPLTLGIENSRRFRGLPLYASLVALGQDGYLAMFERGTAFADLVGRWMAGESGGDYALVGGAGRANAVADRPRSSVVLFRAGDTAPHEFRDEPAGAERLAEAINATGRMYVTPTRWRGRGAIRLAVCGWRTGLRRLGVDYVGGGVEEKEEKEEGLLDGRNVEDYGIVVETLCLVMKTARGL